MLNPVHTRCGDIAAWQQYENIVGSCFQSQQLIQHREGRKKGKSNDRQRQEEMRSNAGHMPDGTFC